MSHYNEKYFDWQKKVGEFGGIANLFKFNDYISESDDVLDFGCGGGYLLNNIATTGKKMGVEINPVARKNASELRVEVYESMSDIPDNSVDVVISNHALEHVDNPLAVIKEMKRVVRPNGKIVIVVPHEVNADVNENDINMHLFTWSPQNLRNLFITAGGVEIIEACRIYHSWPKKYYYYIQRIVGWTLFHKICVINSHLRKLYQTRVAVYVRK